MDEGNTPPITEREQRILSLICEGKTNREIAADFGVQTGRIDGLVNRIKKKTGTHSKKELQAWATRSIG